MFSSNTSAANGAANYIEDVFSTWLYTGNGSTQTVTNGIDLAGKGGLVWLKSRSTANSSHVLIDSARGSRQILSSNTTANQVTAAVSEGITAFNANGFSLGTNVSSDIPTNTSAATYASWTFRKQPKFFDVVTFSTNASSGTDSPVAHALASTPGCIIIKSLSTGNWFVWHRAMNATTPNRYRALLNSTFQAVDEGAEWVVPTSTSFNIPNSVGTLGASQTYVAYLFAHNAGGFGLSGTDNVISCGSFTTDGSGNASVNLGYEPQWIMTKCSSNPGFGTNWSMLDTMRGWTASAGLGNVQANLIPNLPNAESNNNQFQPNATGFTVTGSFTSSTIIYIAIRRGPMKTPTSGTSVFAPIARTGTGSATTVTGVGFAPDLVIPKARANNSNISTFDRLRGALRKLATTATDAEILAADTLTGFDSMDGFRVGADGTYDINYTVNYINYAFRRAPSFFDVVCYTGTGSATTFSHNLGVAPELMIVKCRSVAGTSWNTYSATLGATQVLNLNIPNATATTSQPWNNTAPTASVFTVGTAGSTNGSGSTHIAYLFASCPGVSKVGSYTGTGTTLPINCGFTAGARFVLIKRTDSTGDWYVWDSARGIVAGNDPYLLLNSTAAEVTSTDYIDTYSAGFEISSTAPAAINASGGTFIYLAIA